MSFSQMFAMLKGGDPVKDEGTPISTPIAKISGGRGDNGSRKNQGRGGPSTSTSTPLYKISERERLEQQAKIQRLKAARLEEEAAKKSAAKKSVNTKTSNSTNTGKTKKTVISPSGSSKPSKKTPSSQSNTRGITYDPRPSKPKKKVSMNMICLLPAIFSTNIYQLNFKDIMKEAEKIDSEKLKVTVKVRKDTPTAPISSRSGREASRSGTRSSSPQSKGASIDKQKLIASGKQKSSGNTVSTGTGSASRNFSRFIPASSSLNKPLPSLLEKQRKRAAEKLKLQKRDDYYDSEEDDGFVVDDEEEERTQMRDVGYDRDEIWSIFNRGKKRSHFSDDDDLSDMEATGSQVLEEEQRSAFHGKKEDELEERELQRRAEEKRRRKIGR